ncbi:hypothetical protein D922_02232 [Enterococcus faecalis 06-MB-DW-09]|nr:hypothetical protein D922_02232 [Enterococcus faecalis 06-MB-DW-09]
MFSNRRWSSVILAVNKKSIWKGSGCNRGEKRATKHFRSS